MEKAKTELLATITKVFSGFGAIALAVSQIVVPEKPLPPPFDKIEIWQRWGICAALVATSFIIWCIQASNRRSRLLKPEAFNLQPDNPSHLKGRVDEINNLKAACQESPLVWLIGESGSGKTALARSGLLLKLNVRTGFLPIYLDAWGNDWETGPMDNLAFAIYHALSAEQRIILEIGDSYSNTSLIDALSRCKVKTGLIPILFFDQFDDYQLSHRSKFVGKGHKRAWLSADALCQQNAFWRKMRKFLCDGSARILFITRSDAADGLEAVRFCEPVSVPLDRLEAAYLSPILDELTNSDEEGNTSIIYNPDYGWTQLKRRLENDIARNGVVLPIHIQACVRGLASLPGHILTQANYERIGGLTGLEASFVERCIAGAHRIYGIEATVARAILQNLVNGTKTFPRPLSELRRGHEEVKAIREILIYWEGLGLVRRRIAWTGHNDRPGERDGDELWALYHDYQTRGVVAAVTRANRWEKLLEECRDAFKDASSPSAKWRALLSPTQQFSILLQRFRGFRYGLHYKFCLLSLIRLLPAFGICCLVGISLFAIRADQREQESRKIASGFVKELSRIDELQLLEVSSLWRLAAADGDIRRAFWKEALQDNEDAGWLLNKGPMDTDQRLEQVFHATIGLDPDHHETEYLVHEVLSPIARRKDLGYFQLLLAAELCHLSASDDMAAQQAIAELIVAAMHEAQTTDLKCQFVEVLVNLRCSLNDTIVDDVEAEVRRLITYEETRFISPKLLRSKRPAAAFARLYSRFSQRKAEEEFDYLTELAEKSEAPEFCEDIVNTTLVLAQRDAKIWKRSFELLLYIYTSASYVSETRESAETALTKLADKIPASEAAEACNYLLELSSKMDFSFSTDYFSKLLTVLQGKPAGPIIEQSFEKLKSKILVEENSGIFVFGLSTWLSRIPKALRDEDRQQIRDHIVGQICMPASPGEDYLGELANITASLNVLNCKLDPDQVVRLDAHMRRLSEESDASDKISIAAAMAEVAMASVKHDEVRVVDFMLNSIRECEDGMKLYVSMPHFKEYGGRLSVDHSSRLVNGIANQYLEDSSPSRKKDLASFLGKLSSPLAPELLREMKAQTVQMIKESRNWRSARDLIDALIALPGRLDTESLQVVVDAVKSPIFLLGMKDPLIGRLEKEAGFVFSGSPSQAARWAAGKGIDVSSRTTLTAH